MIDITPNLKISEKELSISAIRAQGAGGQNVNKVSSAVQLRFDIDNSSLPSFYKEQLLRLADRRITRDGVIVIKAQQYRTFEQNREDAIERLKNIIILAGRTQKKRKPTKPSKNSRKKRVDSKVHRGKIKSMRKKVQ